MQFFGLEADIPKDWHNQSTILFVAPPAASMSIPAATQQAPLAQMTVVFVPPVRIEGDAKSELESRLAEMARSFKEFSIQKREEWRQDGRDYAAAWCTTRDGLRVGQIIGVTVKAGVAAGFIGTAPQVSFAQAEPQLLKIFREMRFSA